MTFKYDVIDAGFNSSFDLERRLNDLGKNGWELVNCQITKEKIGYNETIKFIGVLKKTA